MPSREATVFVCLHEVYVIDRIYLFVECLSRGYAGNPGTRLVHKSAGHFFFFLYQLIACDKKILLWEYDIFVIFPLLISKVGRILFRLVLSSCHLLIILFAIIENLGSRENELLHLLLFINFRCFRITSYFSSRKPIHTHTMLVL